MGGLRLGRNAYLRENAYCTQRHGLGYARREQRSEKGVQAEFEVICLHDAVDGASCGARVGGSAVPESNSCPWAADGRSAALDLLGVDTDELELLAMGTLDYVSGLRGWRGIGCAARSCRQSPI
jgi:hypothetical protein